MAQTSGVWISDPKAYREKLKNLLGKRDPFDVLGSTADVLTDIVRRHTPQQMRSRPFEGKWTPNEVIGHLGDTEWVYGFRLRLILSEEAPPIIGMDQDLWVAAQRHNARKPTDLVDQFRELRQHNLALWRQMTPDELKRFGRHNERGEESLGMILTMTAGHDLSHIDQINRYLEAVKKT